MHCLELNANFFVSISFCIYPFLFIGGGELYVWGTNENGCLGIGYSFLHCFIVEFVGWSSHPY